MQPVLFVDTVTEKLWTDRDEIFWANTCWDDKYIFVVITVNRLTFSLLIIKVFIVA